VYDRREHPARYRFVRIPDDLSPDRIDQIFAAALKVAKATRRDDHIPAPQCALHGIVRDDL
jgi:hypothetical protein